jgi:hypothetical protein
LRVVSIDRHEDQYSARDLLEDSREQLRRARESVEVRDVFLSRVIVDGSRVNLSIDP